MTVQDLKSGDMKKVQTRRSCVVLLFQQATFDEEVYVVSTGSNYVYDTTEIQITYQSFTTPKTWYNYNMAFHTKKQLKQQEVFLGETEANHVGSGRLSPVGIRSEESLRPVHRWQADPHLFGVQEEPI